MNIIEHFDNLPDDVHLEVFKYLRINDKIKLERVNKRWQSNCDGALRRSQSLIVVLPRCWFTANFGVQCIYKRHFLSSQDTLTLPQVKGSMRTTSRRSEYMVTIEKVLKRTPNLKVFAMKRIDRQVLDLLATNCPNLEHLVVKLKCTIGGTVRLPSLTCVSGPVEYLNAASYESLTFRENNLFQTLKAIQLIKGKLNVFKSDTDYLETPIIDAVAEECSKSLKFLRSTSLINQHTLGTIFSFTNLEGIDITLNGQSTMNKLINAVKMGMPKLAFVYLRLVHQQFPDVMPQAEESLAKLIMLVGFKMRLFGIETFCLKSFKVILKQLAASCPQIEAISIRETNGFGVSTPKFEGFKKLGKLRCIRLEADINGDLSLVLIDILTNCPKIRYASPSRVVYLDAKAKIFAARYAKSHPRRHIILANSKRICKNYADNLEFRRYYPFDHIKRNVLHKMLH